MPTATETSITEQRLFDVKDAAAYLQALGAKGVTVYFVRTLINTGQLERITMGKKFIVTKTSLDNWLNRSAKKVRP